MATMESKIKMLSTISLVLVLFWAEFCAAQTGCQLPLGMESGAILDSQVSATTWVNVLEGPRYARLHNRDGGGGWTASTMDLTQYLTIDLGSVATITGVATQGRFNSGDYVTAYNLMYSITGSRWTTYSESFLGNSDSNLIHKNVLPNSIEARYVRFNPLLFNGAPSMRVEVYGCFKDTAYFDGRAYIKYDVSRPTEVIQAEEDLILMRFRTTKPDGILLAGLGTHSDYIFLQLRGGKVLLSVNLGDIANQQGFGATLLEGGSLLDDNQWHLVEYKRDRQTIELTVDGMTVAKKTSGYFSRLDLNREVTVGGSSVRQHVGLSVYQSFVGCLQNVLLSNSVDRSRLGIALNFIKGLRDGAYPSLSLIGQLEYDCRGTETLPVTFTTRESYIKWPGPNLSQNFTVSLKFRTFSSEGLLIQNQLVSTSGGSITVGITDGVPIVQLRSGNQAPMDIFGEGSDLNDGRWHSLRLEMASNSYRWTVDGDSAVTQRTFSILTEQNYFLGGTDGSQSGELAGFRGCMMDVYLGDTKVDFQSILTNSMPAGATVESVDIDTCSLEDWCTPSPCANDGTCQSDWDTFECTCMDTGYTGTTCSIAQNAMQCVSEGSHTIDPDGSGPLAPFSVECERQDDEIFTVVHHDAESQEEVTPGSVAAGSYSRDVTYMADPGQIQAVLDMAEYCEQAIQYDCKMSRLLNSPKGEPFGWWVNWNGQAMDYWGGAAPGTKKCACGLFGSCSDRTKWCNCDQGDAQNRVDEGLLRHKRYLPVKQLRFGDVGEGATGKHTLGPLKCRGNAYDANIVTFRSREAHLLLPVVSLDAKAIVLSFKFKTTQSAGVLAAADGTDDTFVKLELEETAILRFSFDYGAGLKEVRVEPSSPINDNQWHHVMLSLDPKIASLSVDQGGAEKINFDMGNMRLRLTDDFVIGASTLQSEGFVGCMGNLQVNGRFIDLVAIGKPARQVDEGCSGKCDYKPCLNEGQCVETYDEIECQCDVTAFEGPYCSREIGSRMESRSQVTYDVPPIEVQDSSQDTIVLAFTTATARGRLLRVENSGSTGMFEEVALTDPEGYLTFTYNLGSGPQVLTSEHRYADSKHHYVEIKRDGSQATLKVDDYQPITTQGGPNEFKGADKIYVGNTDVGQTFEGCISRVKFNNFYPLAGYFASPRAAGAASAGSLQKSRCNVVEAVPELPEPEGPRPVTEGPPTEGPGPLPPAAQSLTPGDKAAIAFVIIILLVALIVLILLVTRYLHQHKGMYHTNEAKGADTAGDADAAVLMMDAKQSRPIRKKEWYI